MPSSQLSPELPPGLPSWDPAWSELVQHSREPEFGPQDRLALERALAAARAFTRLHRFGRGRKPTRPCSPALHGAPAPVGRQVQVLARLLAAGTLAAGVFGAPLAQAAPPSAPSVTITVTTLSDGAPGQVVAGSLRWALRRAQAAGYPGPDVITFQSGLSGQLTLTNGPLYVDSSVEIQGPGADQLTVSGDNASRVFYLYPNARLYPNGEALDVTISGIKIANGSAYYGAGIYSRYANLTLDHVTITGNTDSADGLGGGGISQIGNNLTIKNSEISGNISGDSGGGVYFYASVDAPGSVLIQDSVIRSNTALKGGGLYGISPASLTIQRSTISGNTAGGDIPGDGGGGLYLRAPQAVTLQQATISGNTAAVNGGGVLIYGYSSSQSAITIENSTISGNQAQSGNGGGIYASYASLQIRSATVSGNTAAGGAGGGIFQDSSLVALQNSIAAGNDAGSSKDLAQAANLNGEFRLFYSLVESPPADFTDLGGSILSLDPQLGPLQDNGGPTWTHFPGNPVINAGDPAFAPPPAVDQRGLPRVISGRVDMGAVEASSVLAFSAAELSAAEGDGQVTITVERSGLTDGAVSVAYTSQNGSAVAPGDYLPVSGSLHWDSGETGPKTFQVAIVDDGGFEPAETLTLALSSPLGGAALGQPNVLTLAIADDDVLKPGVLTFALAEMSTAEGAGQVTITVNRSGGTDGAVSVSYAAQNGTAVAPGDYLPVSGTLHWNAGEAGPKTFQVTIVADNVFEAAKTFTLALSNPAGGASLGQPNVLTLVIAAGSPFVLHLPAVFDKPR